MKTEIMREFTSYGEPNIRSIPSKYIRSIKRVDKSGQTREINVEEYKKNPESFMDENIMNMAAIFDYELLIDDAIKTANNLLS